MFISDFSNMWSVYTSDDNSERDFHAELNMSLPMTHWYTWYIEHGDELNHPMLDVSEFLSEVDNPEDNIEYYKEGRKAHQDALVNSERRRKL